MKKTITFLFAFVVIIVHAQQEFGILDINNIHCNVSSTGDLFNRFGDDELPGFEVPASSGIRSIYAGNLWVSGRTDDQIIHLVGEMYQDSGQDWFSGPLTNDGSASITQETEDAYNHVWVANLADVQQHQLYYHLLNTGQNPLEAFPDGYVIPQWMNDWPAHGNTALGQDFFLAPFYDANGDAVYSPEVGDYPLFCGDQCLFFIINDKGDIHSETGGVPIGLEVRGMLYAFASDSNDMLNNTVFLKYEIINQGSLALHDSQLGLWLDYDLGRPTDDYLATNIENGSVYVYNGDGVDEASSVGPGYDSDLAIQGTVLLKGLRKDADEMDNPITSDVQDALLNDGIPYDGIGLGYDDGIVNNEYLGLRHSMYMQNSIDPAFGLPASGNDYCNYLKGFWKDGVPLSYGGNGHEANGIQANYIFPNDSDPLDWGTSGVAVDAWSEEQAGNPPGDRIALLSSGSATINPGHRQFIDMAFVFARESDDTLSNVLDTYNTRVDEVRSYYLENLIQCLPSETPNGVSEVKQSMELSVFPNPASDFIRLNISNAYKNGRVSLYNATGSLVHSESVKGYSIKLDVKSFSSGIYTLTLESELGLITKKIMID
jgi:hypothetical protein